ncbi:MAG TPA: TusE/DsrC/DsvC family sulfur relay protein [Gammaproteobacteria bacterium]|nr:TusE/DsrC/DsvC family sulfur relay protein [Gammaproteobacteria bacterium]
MEVDGCMIEIDADGYLVNSQDWTEKIATEIARNEGIKLTESHWEIIGFVRKHYENKPSSPTSRGLTKSVAETLGKEKGNSTYLYELFPCGPARQVCKIAGLAKPASPI